MIEKLFAAALVMLAFFLAACSGENSQTGAASEEIVNSARKPALIAYACADGTKAFTEQGAEDTTLYLIDGTSSHAERLSTPSLGMPYFGDNLEVRVARDGLRIDRLKEAPMFCKRL
jgi:hypothetical protein